MEVRRFNPESDLEPLQELFEEVMDRHTAREIWEWKYRSPWAEEILSWVGFHDGKLIGHMGAVHLRGTVNGQEVPFFQLGDIVVHPSRRAKWDFLGSTPKRLFAQIEALHPTCVYYGFTGRRASLLYRRLGGVFAEDARDRIWSVARAGVPSEPEGVEVGDLSWDDERIDYLWSRLKPSNGLIRDRVWLGWRYRDYPLYGHRLLGVWLQSDLVGWVVVHEESLDGGPREDVRVLDQLLPNELLEATLQAVSRLANAGTSVLWHPSRLWKGHSRETSWIVICQSKVPGYTSEDLSQQFYYTLGEADEWWW